MDLQATSTTQHLTPDTGDYKLKLIVNKLLRSHTTQLHISGPYPKDGIPIMVHFKKQKIVQTESSIEL